jgi:hypothetical protein
MNIMNLIKKKKAYYNNEHFKHLVKSVKRRDQKIVQCVILAQLIKA